MAFPVVSSVTDTDFGTSVTSMAVNMPATVDAGDRLVALVSVRNAGTWNTVPTGWSNLKEQAGGGAVGETSIFEKIADGTEDGGTATWVTSTATSAAWQVLRITGAHASTASEVTSTSGDASAANPPSETASWGGTNNLWLAIAGHSAAVTNPWSAAPTNYSGFAQNGASSGGAAVAIAHGYRERAINTEDPGTFTVDGSNRFWAAATLVVRPLTSLAFTDKLSNNSNTDANSYTTASHTPTADTLQLLTVTSRTGISTDPNAPTVTGNGLTWVQIATTVYDNSSSSRRRITLFRAMGASPSAGALTIDFGGQTQTSAQWSVIEVSGTDTSGTNGSGAIVQSATNQDTTGDSSTLSVTLSAFASSDNATFGAFSTGGTGGTFTGTPGTGFTSLSNVSNGEGDMQLNTEYLVGTDTSVDYSWTGGGSSEMGGIAVEIKVAGAAAGSDIKKALGVLQANLQDINLVAEASVKKYMGVDNT